MPHAQKRRQRHQYPRPPRRLWHGWRPSPSRSPSLRRRRTALVSRGSSAAVATAASSSRMRCHRCRPRLCRRGCAT
ncbi:hypothetical protein Ctob_010623, partial [Chrysochromulina tobinii]